MPRRWISIRGRKRLNGQDQDDSADFNFVFIPVDSPRDGQSCGVGSPSMAYKTEMPRPNTSSGIREKRAQHRQGSGKHNIRPQTSEGRSPPPFSLAQPNKDMSEMIGVACGSPTHPPTYFYGALDSITPVDFGAHAFAQQGPFLDEGLQASKSKWKKFGSLFKGKPLDAQRPPEPFYQLQVEDGYRTEYSTTRESSELIRSPSRSPSNSSVELDAEIESFPAPPTTSHSTTSNTDFKPQGPGTASRCLPRLQVEIPSAKMDRYTMMFRDVPGVHNFSNLLARRSKNLDQLQSDSRPLPPLTILQPLVTGSELLAAPRPSARRQTSPTFSRASTSYSLYPTVSPAASKSSHSLSLFPGGPTVPSRPHGRSHLQRAMTSPARLSPMRDTFEADKPQPLRLGKNSGNDRWLASPEKSTASTDQTTIWSPETFLSPASIATTVEDEILFDVKSFRNSKGVSGDQFEMTRPTSNAVALYRTISYKQKAMKKKKPKVELPASVGSPNMDEDLDDTRTIDETIAVVEKLTSSTTLSRASPTPKPHIGQLLSNSSRSESREAMHPRGFSPSPMAEVARASNSSPTSVPVPISIQPARAPAAQPEPAQAITQPLASPPPPPVPAKDSKFIPAIPVSKYSSKAGPRPSPPRALRSATESFAVRSTRSRQDAMRHPASRSHDSLADASPRKASKATHLKTAQTQHQHSREVNGPALEPSSMLSNVHRVAPQQPVTVNALIQPAAEVAVARTVQLARKESRRVLVTRGGTSKQLEEEEACVSKMELLAQRKYNPVVVEVEKGHRIGQSVGVLIESV